MPCYKKLRQKIMNSVRRKHPNYSLKRRKRIVSAVIYRRRKK